MKRNAFHNHVHHKIIFSYCRIVLFKFWNLNSIIVGWLICTSLSQLYTFCMQHVNPIFGKVEIMWETFDSMEVKN